MGMFSGLVSKYSSTGRRLKRKTRSLEKARQKAQIADIESELAFRQTEDPREQSMLKQSMFGRGLGKSSIATQGAARLTSMQARRRAALERQKDLAHRGLSLIKLRARAARRMAPLEMFEDLAGATYGAAQIGGWLAGGDVGTNGLDESGL